MQNSDFFFKFQPLCLPGQRPLYLLDEWLDGTQYKCRRHGGEKKLSTSGIKNEFQGRPSFSLSTISAKLSHTFPFKKIIGRIISPLRESLLS